MIKDKLIQISEHKFVELSLLRFNPKVWKYHFSFVDLSCTLSIRGDHSPSFSFRMALLGLRVVEFHFYDNRHEDEEMRYRPNYKMGTRR